MGLKDPKVGFNSVTEFMGSGLPWVTSSMANGGTTYNIKFPKITKRLSVWNHEAASGKHIRVGFTKNGVETGGRFFLVDSGQTFEFDARVKEVFIRSDDAADNPLYSLYAELVGIDSDMMPILTGSINGTVFWEGVG
jgi:hypothetical protein